MKKSIEDLSSMLNVPSITSGKLQVASRMNREYIEVSNDLKSSLNLNIAEPSKPNQKRTAKRRKKIFFVSYSK